MGNDSRASGKSATEMHRKVIPKSLHEESSQYRHWTWKSTSEIAAIREETTFECLERIVPLIKEEAVRVSLYTDVLRIELIVHVGLYEMIVLKGFHIQ